VLKLALAVLALSVVSSHCPADTVELVNGDLLHGTVVQQTDQAVVMDHPVLGRVHLSTDRVKAVIISPVQKTDGQEEKPPPAANTQAAATTESPAAADTPDPLTHAPQLDTFSARILPGWDKHLELGITGSDGNSQTFNLNAGFNAKKEDDSDRWIIRSKYFRNEDDGNRTRNEFTGELVRDWLMPDSPWFKFASGRLEYDEFQDWQTRPSGFMGVGRVLRDTPKHNLKGRAGLGGSYEFGTVNELVPEATLGLEWDYTINDHQKLASYINVFPDLNEYGQSRAIAGAEWIIKIDEADGMSLKLGVYDEYESRTEGSAKHNDAKYYGALVFDF
jgi:putative salt-induced outer membrane protein YdiY